jgi:hypothetical protein
MGRVFIGFGVNDVFATSKLINGDVSRMNPSRLGYETR